MGIAPWVYNQSIRPHLGSLTLGLVISLSSFATLQSHPLALCSRYTVLPKLPEVNYHFLYPLPLPIVCWEKTQPILAVPTVHSCVVQYQFFDFQFISNNDQFKYVRIYMGPPITTMAVLLLLWFYNYCIMIANNYCSMIILSANIAMVFNHIPDCPQCLTMIKSLTPPINLRWWKGIVNLPIYRVTKYLRSPWWSGAGTWCWVTLCALDASMGSLECIPTPILSVDSFFLISLRKSRPYEEGFLSPFLPFVFVVRHLHYDS